MSHHHYYQVQIQILSFVLDIIRVYCLINQQLDFIGVQKQINVIELQVTDLDYGKSITVVKYKITGTASSGKTTEVESEFILPKSQKENFTPYEDVTEDLVSKWIESLDDNYLPLSSKVNEELAKRVEVVKNPWG